MLTGVDRNMLSNIKRVAACFVTWNIALFLIYVFHNLVLFLVDTLLLEPTIEHYYNDKLLIAISSQTLLLNKYEYHS